MILLLASMYGISTHSLTRRLTYSSFLGYIAKFYFNSQPHKEADNLLGGKTENPSLFQLTASQGG